MDPISRRHVLQGAASAGVLALLGVGPAKAATVPPHQWIGAGPFRLTVVAIAPSGLAAFHRRQAAPSGGWDDWQWLSGWTTAAPMPAPSADGRLEAFVLSPGGERLSHRWQVTPGGSWHPGEDFGEPGVLLAATPTAAADATGRCHVFAVTTDGRIRKRAQAQPSGGWQSWTAFGDRVVAPVRSGGPAY